jgi:hypothetical protein
LKTAPEFFQGNQYLNKKLRIDQGTIGCDRELLISLQVQAFLTCKEDLLGFFALGIGHATIHRTNRRALWLLMKSNALGALVRYYIIIVFCPRLVFLTDIRAAAVLQCITTFDFRAVGDCPFHASLIDGIVGTFRFAGAAIDAVVSNHYCHSDIDLTV